MVMSSHEFLSSCTVVEAVWKSSFPASEVWPRVNQISLMFNWRPLWFAFTQWEVELSVLDQLFWPVTAAPILSLALIGIPWYLLSLSPSLSLSLSLSSLAAVVALLSLPLAPYRNQRRGRHEGKWREKKEPPVTSSFRSRMASGLNLLHYWFPKSSNCIAMVFSGLFPAATRIEQWPDDASTSLCVCVCLHLRLFL